MRVSVYRKKSCGDSNCESVRSLIYLFADENFPHDGHSLLEHMAVNSEANIFISSQGLICDFYNGRTIDHFYSYIQ